MVAGLHVHTFASHAALSGQPAYDRIRQYTSQTCGTTIGGAPPPATNPVTVTTIADPDVTGPDATGVGTTLAP